MIKPGRPAVDYESHQRILFLFSRALINRDLVTSFMMNAIIIIVPSFIMRGYLDGIIHSDRSCCLMHQASWASDPAIALHSRISCLSRRRNIINGNSFVLNYDYVIICVLLFDSKRSQ